MTELKMGDRFKDYERVSDTHLVRRLPVIARFDIRAGHSLTKRFDRPYDQGFANAMKDTAIELLKEIQGAKCAYTQSDEISVLITDYDTIQTECWFSYRVQKMASIGASLATLAFNKALRDYKSNPGIGMFDARFFNMPENDVCNYFVWRQKDAERNSLQMLAQANFSHKSLQNLNGSALQEKLFTEKGINYNDIDSYQKRGIFIHKSPSYGWWAPAFDTPIFSQNREVIEELIPKL